MHSGTARRAAIAAATLSLAFAGVAAADSVAADSDTVTAGIQGMVYLGTVPAGATIERDLGFQLVCSGLGHVPAGTTISLTPTAVAPLDGTISASTASVGPVPDTWPGANEACVGDPVLDATEVSHVTLTAPSTPGTGYVYRITFDRSPSGGTSGTTLAQLALSVSADPAPNTPPSLSLPGDLTVEADHTGGWIAAYTATATDAEDDPDPLVDCTPAPGDLVPLGDTTVACAATDSGGMTSSGSFDVHVRDTTAPKLGAMPDIAVTATGPAGATVTWSRPVATDVVDPSPAVGCAPSSGTVFAVGTTRVTCTATDTSGNQGSTTFSVAVRPAPAAMSVRWDSPLGGEVLISRLGRTVPVKASIRTGSGWLIPADGAVPALRVDALDACGDASAVNGRAALVDMTWSGGRWTAHVDTGGLAAGCWRLVVVVDGSEAGATGLQLVGDHGAVGTAKALGQHH
jgi:HYR domain